MSEEERSNLYIYVYSALDDDLIFAETKYTLADLHKLQRENQQLKEKLQQKEDNINKAQEEFISEFYSCDNEEALKRLYSKLCCLKEENQQLKEQQKEFKKTLRDKLIKYFDIENDSYFYILTRDKSAYQYGTMRFDDFKEFDIEQIDDLIKFLFNKRSDE